MLYLFAIVAGLANAIQAACNAALIKGMRNPFLVVFISLCVSLVVSVAAGVALRQINSAQATPSDVPWWAWFGGAFGAVLLLSQPVAAGRLGASTYVGLLVTASVIASILLDHYGALGFAQHTAGLPRIAGAILMVVGVTLVALF